MQQRRLHRRQRRHPHELPVACSLTQHRSTARRIWMRFGHLRPRQLWRRRHPLLATLRLSRLPRRRQARGVQVCHLVAVVFVVRPLSPPRCHQRRVALPCSWGRTLCATRRMPTPRRFSVRLVGALRTGGSQRTTARLLRRRRHRGPLVVSVSRWCFRLPAFPACRRHRQRLLGLAVRPTQAPLPQPVAPVASVAACV